MSTPLTNAIPSTRTPGRPKKEKTLSPAERTRNYRERIIFTAWQTQWLCDIWARAQTRHDWLSVADKVHGAAMWETRGHIDEILRFLNRIAEERAEL